MASIADKAMPIFFSNSLRITLSPFGYYGAKNRLVRSLIEILLPHHAWVDEFCGSAVLTLAKILAPIEVLNDRHGEVVNVFEQLRSNQEELCRTIALTPYARDEFHSTRHLEKAQDPIERARRIFVGTMMTVNGTYSPPTTPGFHSPTHIQGSEKKYESIGGTNYLIDWLTKYNDFGVFRSKIGMHVKS